MPDFVRVIPNLERINRFVMPAYHALLNLPFAIDSIAYGALRSTVKDLKVDDNKVNKMRKEHAKLINDVSGYIQKRKTNFDEISWLLLQNKDILNYLFYHALEDTESNDEDNP